MFTDPQTLTVNSAPKTLPRIQIQGTSALYQNSDGTYAMRISHQSASGNRIRTLVRVDFKAVVPDPITAVNDEENLQVHFVIDRPVQGFSATTVDQLVQALKAWLTTTAVNALYGREI